MTRKNKEKKKTQRRKEYGTTTEPSPSITWIDRLEFLPPPPPPPQDEDEHKSAGQIDVEDQSSNTFISDENDRLRIISWNVLAEAYCNPRSHRNLPDAKDVFSVKKRRVLLKRRLGQLALGLNLDFLCLQEVDMLREVSSVLQDEFQGLHSPIDKGFKVDAVGVWYRKLKWARVDHQVVNLDDLATLGSTNTDPSKPQWQNGLQQSFLRRNMAIICKFENRKTKQRVVVTNVHLFWNPEYEYVKLCQIYYVTMQSQTMANKDEDQPLPVILAGDLNSKPGSSVHRFLSLGQVNAKRVAPWYHHYNFEADGAFEDLEVINDDAATMDKVSQDFSTKLSLSSSSSVRSTPSIKYICDFTLNHLTRWLRILGVDCALETADEERERTKVKGGKTPIFDRCRQEGRTLITTSLKLLQRKTCPPGSFLIHHGKLGKLESVLVELLLTHGVSLNPKDFLSRCVVCNGAIINVSTDVEAKRRIFAENNAPDLSDEIDQVYECSNCKQGYWWSDRPQSSASRVKSQATRLLQACLRGGIPLTDEDDLHMFHHVSVKEERELGRLEGQGSYKDSWKPLQWLEQEQLKLDEPLILRSAYADATSRVMSHANTASEATGFTNVTSDFVGFLDYVFYPPDLLTQTRRLYLPASFRELAPPPPSLEDGLEPPKNGHLLPSSIWPSDHLAIGVELEWSAPRKKSAKDSSG